MAQRVLEPRGARDPVAQSFGHQLHAAAHAPFVLDDEDRERPRRAAEPRPLGLRCGRGHRGQLDAQARATPLEVVHVQPPAHRFHDPEADREPQAGARLPLRGEERLEDPVQDLGRHSRPRVLERERDLIVDAACVYGELAGAAGLLDRLLRVDDGVEYDLLQFLRVARHVRQVGRQGHFDLDAGFLEGVALQGEHPLHDLEQVHGLAHARPLAREVEQRLHDPPGAHGLHVDQLAALLEIRIPRAGGEQLREGRDRGQGVVQLVSDAGHEGAELRQPVRLEELLLQQHLARYVGREEQQLRHRVLGIQVVDDRLHLARRLPRELEAQPERLAARHRVAQRLGESGALIGHRPIRERAPAEGGEIRDTEQRRGFGVGVENLTVHGEHQRRRRQRGEQLLVEPSLRIDRSQEVSGAGVLLRVHPRFAEAQDQMIPRPPRHLGLEHPALKVAPSRSDERARHAVLEHFLEQPLDGAARRGGEREPEVPAHHPVGGDAGEVGGGRAPLRDRPIRGDHGDAHVQTVHAGMQGHVRCSSQTQRPRWPIAGATGPNTSPESELVRSAESYVWNGGCGSQGGRGVAGTP